MSAFTKTISVSLNFKYSFFMLKCQSLTIILSKGKLPNGLFHPFK